MPSFLQLCLPHILLGAVTLRYMRTSAANYFSNSINVCGRSILGFEENPLEFAFTSVFPVDMCTCVITKFFQDALSRPEGQVICSILLCFFSALFVFFAIESCKKTALWFVNWSWATVLASQLLSVAFAFPVLWCPSFALSNRMKKRRSPINTAGMPIIRIMVASLLFMATCIIMSFRLLPTLDVPLIFLFNWTAPVLSALWMTPLPFLKSSNRPAPITTAYNLTTVALTLWHFATIATYARTDISFTNFKAIFSLAGDAHVASHFLLLDLFSTWVSMVLFVSLHIGMSAALKFACLSPVVGPGAAAMMMCAAREKQLIAEQLKEE